MINVYMVINLINETNYITKTLDETYTALTTYSQPTSYKSWASIFIGDCSSKWRSLKNNIYNWCQYKISYVNKLKQCKQWHLTSMLMTPYVYVVAINMHTIHYNKKKLLKKALVLWSRPNLHSLRKRKLSLTRENNLLEQVVRPRNLRSNQLKIWLNNGRRVIIYSELVRLWCVLMSWINWIIDLKNKTISVSKI
jgi:hypothetical protein